ncbi:MAG: cupredoxin family copper-binding protein [Acidimicrobiales bacterium]
MAVLAGALVVGGVIGLAQQRDEPAPAPPGSTEVAISGFLFGPKELSVRPGDTVTWTNQDNTMHTITGKDAAAKASLDSENLRNADTYEVTFTDAGAFQYFCVFHPNMQGTITVEG